MKIHEISARESEKLLAENSEIIVVDCRTLQEFADGHVAGARNLDFYADNFADLLAEIPRSQKIFLHCRSGVRSRNALDIFERLGFEEIWHLTAGFLEWEEEGLPIKT